MAMIPNDVIDKVRSQTKIQDIVGKYIHLSRSGKNLFAHCPFHEDRTPSFCVSPQRQIFHCFSCGRGGDVFKFLMEIKGMSFPQSVMAVAKDDGINLSGQYMQNRSRRPVNKLNQTLIRMYNKAAQLYHHILIDTEAGQKALDYLHRRGLTDDTINAYNLGFAPKHSLLKTLFAGQHINAETIRKSGLFGEYQNGEVHDRFSNRVMYPIRNRNGQTIALSGRVLNKKASPAKYVNSPETPIFHKSDVLFNLDKIKPAVRKTKTVILFEGYMDVMSAYQSKIQNGIASMGTSLTDSQVHKIESFSRKVIVCYDGDTPGQRAINRAVDMLLTSSHLQVSVVQMPSGIDPDEYRQKFGEKQLYRYVHINQETPTAFRLRFYKLGLNLSNQHDQLTYLQNAVKAIAQVSTGHRSFYLNRLAKEFDVDVNDLKQQVANVVQHDQVVHQISQSRRPAPKVHIPQRQSAPLPRPKTREEAAEQILLNRILFNHNVWQLVTSTNGFHFNGNYRAVYDIAYSYFCEHDRYDPDQFVQYAQRVNLGPLVKYINHLNLPEQVNISGIKDCVKIVMKAPLQKQLQAEQHQLNVAGDGKQAQQAFHKIIELKRKLGGLQNG